MQFLTDLPFEVPPLGDSFLSRGLPTTERTGTFKPWDVSVEAYQGAIAQPLMSSWEEGGDLLGGI